ncbi:MAG: tetratricopeptide repeat protein [Myxococcota bacterium]
MLAALGLAAGPRVAHAEPAPLPDVTEVPDAETPDEDPMLKQAMDAYERGTANFNAEHYETALSDFKEAASLYASADFQYNIARCYEELGKHEEAVRAFETYLKAKPDADDRAAVENRIKLLEKLIEEERKRKEQEAKGGKTVVVKEVGEDRTAKRQRMARPLIISGAVLAGVGVLVAAGGGLGFGLAAKSRSDALETIQTGGNPEDSTFDDAQTLADDGQRFETIQIAMLAAGGGVAGIGAGLLGVGVSFKKGPKAAALVPRLSPGQAGLSLVGRF